jgi:hypothetical protein
LQAARFLQASVQWRWSFLRVVVNSLAQCSQVLRVGLCWRHARLK